MLRRLIEVNYLTFRSDVTAPRIDFWLRELRTPSLLIESAASFDERAHALTPSRPLLRHALARDPDAITIALREEENAERQADREYWAPLRAELEALRHGRTT